MNRLMIASALLVCFYGNSSIVNGQTLNQGEPNPIPYCDGYQFRTDIIYSEDDEKIDRVLTKINSANFYLMIDAGATPENFAAGVNEMARVIELIKLHYSINPPGTPLKIKYDCVPKSLTSFAQQNGQGWAATYFGDSSFYVQEAHYLDLGGDYSHLFSEPDPGPFGGLFDSWSSEYESFDGCFSGTATHDSGWFVGIGGCAGDDGFGLGVNEIRVGFSFSF